MANISEMNGKTLAQIAEVNNKIKTYIGQVNDVGIQVQLKTGLLGCWEMEETSGTNVDDSHTNGYDFTMSGVTINQTGKIGQCFSYDGSNDYIYYNAANNNLTPASNHSMSAWIKRLGDSTGGAGLAGAIMTKYYSSTGTRSYFWNVQNSDDGTIPNRTDFSYWDSANAKGTVFYDPGSDIWTNNWVHVVATRSGTTMKIYINGINVATATSQGNGSMKQNTTYAKDFIGGCSRSSYTPDQFFYGLIDQVASWNVALSQDQVNTLYNGGSGLAYSSWF